MDPLDAILAQRREAHRDAAARVGATCSDAWLSFFIRAVRSDPPRLPAVGWLLVGKVRDRSWGRHALVTVHPHGRARLRWDEGTSPEALPRSKVDRARRDRSGGSWAPKYVVSTISAGAGGAILGSPQTG